MFKKRNFILGFIMALFISNTAYANPYFHEIRTVSSDKTWTIKFNDFVDREGIGEYVRVIDEYGDRVNSGIEIGKDGKSIVVQAPTEEYKVQKMYTLVIEDGLQSLSKIKLNRDINLKFYIDGKSVSEDMSLEKVIHELIQLPNESYDENEAKKMIDRLSKVDIKILRELLKKDVKIILSNTNVTGVEEYAYLAGVVPRGWEGTGKTWDDVPGAGGNPVVARIGYSESGNEHGSFNLELHETAHAIDRYVFWSISSGEEFKSIMKKEAQSIFPNDNYVGVYPEEYFAETFSYYHLDNDSKETLRKKAPLTYEFIKNLPHRI